MNKRWMLLLMAAGLLALGACDKKEGSGDDTEATAEETTCEK